MWHGQRRTDFLATGDNPSNKPFTRLLPITVFVAPRSTTPMLLYVANSAACSPVGVGSAWHAVGLVVGTLGGVLIDLGINRSSGVLGAAACRFWWCQFWSVSCNLPLVSD